MAGIQTSIILERQLYDAWKASGQRLSHLVRLGLMAKNETPGYISRIRELEEGNAKLQRAVTNALNRIRELEAKE